jgi:hypothetical protein
MKFTTTITLLGLICLANATEIPTTCIGNPCYNRFKADADSAAGSAVKDTPQSYTGNICKSEWETYGTCCDPTKIIELQNKRMDQWKGRLAIFTTKVENFLNLVISRKDEILYQAKKCKDMLADTTNTALQTKITSGAKIEAENLCNAAPTILETIDSQTIKDDFEKYKVGMKVCFDTINKFRLGNVCAMCSPRAAEFVNNEGRLKISQDTCTSIVAACAPSWKFSFTTITIMKSLLRMRKVRKFATESSTIQKSTTDAQDSSADTEKLAAILESINLSDLSGLVYNDDVRDLCINFLNADQPNDQIENPKNEDFDQAENEQKQEKQEEDAKTGAEKTAFQAEVAAAKSAEEQKKQQRWEGIASAEALLTAKIAEYEAQRVALATAIDQKKIFIGQKNTELGLMNNSTSTTTADMEIQLKEAEIKAKMGEMKVASTGLSTLLFEIDALAVDMMQKCGTAKKCPQLGTKLQQIKIKRSEDRQKAEEIKKEEEN